MTKWARLLPMVAIFFSALLALQGCVSDEERCDEGQRYENGGCVPIVEDAGPQDDAMQGDAVWGDGIETDAAPLPSGMGDVCSGPDDCADKDADYCLIQPPATTGACTLQNCAIAPDDCPDSFTCCDFSIEEIPNFCATDADYATLKGLSMCL